MSYRKSQPHTSKFKPQSPRLMDKVREVLRYHHYSLRTEQSYTKWILAFIRFNGRRHPETLGKTEIEAFLSDMAVNKHYAAATQSLALNAIVFLYKQVLDIPIAKDLVPVRSKKPVRLPVVLSQSEITDLLSAMTGVNALLAKGIYGGGLRVMEALRLRVKEIDFANGTLQNHSESKRAIVQPTSLPPFRTR